MCEQCSFFTRTQEPYALLLERREWAAKRSRILIRDGRRCQHCGTQEGKDVHLQVHHKHYSYGLDPWEYKDSELVTLCEACHSSLHTRYQVPVYRLDGDNLVEIHLTPCHRCGGAGWFPEYKHVQGGICFRCHGQRYEEHIELVKKYAEEHNISLDDFDDGFRPINDKERNEIQCVVVSRNEYRHEMLMAEIHMQNGIFYRHFLDYSVEAKPGEKLNLDTLKLRCATNKNGREYLIIKGAPIRNT